MAALHQRTGHNVTREPRYPPGVLTQRRNWQQGEEEEEEEAVGRETEREKRQNNGCFPLSLLLTLCTCVNIHKRCSYIILPWNLMSQASSPWHFRLAGQPLLQCRGMHPHTRTYTKHSGLTNTGHHSSCMMGEHKNIACHMWCKEARHIQIYVYCPSEELRIKLFVCGLCVCYRHVKFLVLTNAWSSLKAVGEYGDRHHAPLQSCWLLPMLHCSWRQTKLLFFLLFTNTCLKQKQVYLVWQLYQAGCTLQSYDCFGCFCIISPSTSKEPPKIV